MRKIQRGEIATIVTIGSLVFILIATIASTFFFKKPQTTSTKAGGGAFIKTVTTYKPASTCSFGEPCECVIKTTTTQTDLCQNVDCTQYNNTSTVCTDNEVPPVIGTCSRSGSYYSGCGGGGGFTCNSDERNECDYADKPDCTCPDNASSCTECCRGINCRCTFYQNCVGATPTDSPNDPTNTPVPGTTSCNRCSANYGCKRANWTNQGTTCDPVIPVGSINYTVDQSCPSLASGDNSACSQTTSCNRCSANYGCKRANWTNQGTTCDPVIPVGSINYTVDQSCPSLASGDNSACSTNPTNTPTPTPPTSGPTNTPVPGCLCSSGGTCAAVCVYDKYSDITYISPVKCSLSPLLFATVPSATNKNSWCQATKRTKGDANGDGVVNDTDYYLYVGAANGGQIPATANPDFNGDGEVGAGDRVIIMKTLKP